MTDPQPNGPVEALGSCLWVLNNRHNAGTDAFERYAKAAEEDARQALATLEAEQHGLSEGAGDGRVLADSPVGGPLAESVPPSEPRPDREASQGEALREDGDYIVDATGHFEGYVSANDAEPPWPAMVSYEWSEGGSLLSDDARALGRKLIAAADEADRRNDAAFAPVPQQQEPRVCPTCEVDHPGLRWHQPRAGSECLAYQNDRGILIEGWYCCTDPWHSRPNPQGEDEG